MSNVVRTAPPERLALTQASVTLNGRPARIRGARLPFALVVDVETGLGCEWAWPTVERIVATTGAFRSH
jgi:hypothetical protein